MAKGKMAGFGSYFGSSLNPRQNVFRLTLITITTLILNNLKLVTKMDGILIMLMHNVSHYLSHHFLISFWERPI